MPKYNIGCQDIIFPDSDPRMGLSESPSRALALAILDTQQVAEVIYLDFNSKKREKITCG